MSKDIEINTQETLEEAPEEARDGRSPEAEGQEEPIDWEKEARLSQERELRAVAELANAARRLEKEKENAVRYANEGLVKDLLPVVDNLERALEHARAEQGAGAIVQGLELTLESFLGTLSRYGVEPVEALGQPFDPNFHEAVMSQADPDSEENTVIAQAQKGYLLKDRLVRPAMVVVSKK